MTATAPPRGAYYIPTEHGADRDWMKDAHCKNNNIDPATFFPVFRKGPDGRNQRKRAIEEARKHCWGPCTVTQQCLAYAIAMDCRYGIWGGLAEEDRPHGGRP